MVRLSYDAYSAEDLSRRLDEAISGLPERPTKHGVIAALEHALNGKEQDKMVMTEQKLLGLTEAAERHGISVWTARRWVSEGRLTTHGTRPVAGGFEYLVNLDDIAHLVKHRPGRGRGWPSDCDRCKAKTPKP